MKIIKITKIRGRKNIYENKKKNKEEIRMKEERKEGKKEEGNALIICLSHFRKNSCYVFDK